MNKEFLNNLDTWDDIITDTYENTFTDSYTFEFNADYPIFEYKIKNKNSLDGFQTVSKTDKIIDYFKTLTFINISNKKDFRVRIIYGDDEGIQTTKVTTKVTTKLKNILINGKPVLDWIFTDPDIDTYETINAVLGFSTYMKQYDMYEDTLINIFIKHNIDDKIIISSNAIFNSDYEIKNNYDLKKFIKTFKR